MKPVRGWPLVLAMYTLLLGVSGVAFLAPTLDTREGRWGVGLALANLTVVALGAGITSSDTAEASAGHGGWCW